MPNENLIFHILTFDFPKRNPVFYFSDTENGKCQKIHKSIFPNEIKSLFPKAGVNGSEFVYTTFTGKTEGLHLKLREVILEYILNFLLISLH